VTLAVFAVVSTATIVRALAKGYPWALNQRQVLSARGRDFEWSGVAHEIQRIQHEWRTCPDHEAHIDYVFLRVVGHIVFHIGLGVPGSLEPVPQADDISLKLQRIERVRADRRYERKKPEEPAEAHHAPLRGQSDARAEVVLAQIVLVLEAK
jgi:hypothetical protein